MTQKKIATVSEEVESLKYTLCICEGREHDHDVEYLMARTEYIESLSAPSLRNLFNSQTGL